LTEGAGFLNAKGAVDLARYFGGDLSVYPSSSSAAAWGRRVIWGNKLVAGGRLLPGTNAWPRSVLWGSSTSTNGEPIELGVTCASDSCDDDGDATWTLEAFRNVVWGPMCGGSDCSDTWTVDLFGATDGDTVVWGTGDTGDTVVWGTTNADNRRLGNGRRRYGRVGNRRWRRYRRLGHGLFRPQLYSGDLEAVIYGCCDSSSVAFRRRRHRPA
jgi:hypothetical protein